MTTNRVTASFTAPNGDSVSHTIITTDTKMTDAMRSEEVDRVEEANQTAADRIINHWIEYITEDEFNYYIYSVDIPE